MSERHGSAIASFCYETPGEISPEDHKHRRIGKLIFYRSHSPDKDPTAQIRLDLIPGAAWAAGIDLFIANFVPCEKVPEPPFIDGDVFATTEDRGDPVFVGHIHTLQNENSKKMGEYEEDPTTYHLKLIGIPVREWIKVRDSNKENKSIYLKVRTD